MTNDHKTANLSLGHEPISADTKRISLSLVGLGLAIAASLIIVAGLVEYWSSFGNKAADGTALSATEREGLGAEVLSGMPQLNPHQADELAALRARQREILSTYAWVNREQGVARIPIQRAIGILAERAGDAGGGKAGQGIGHDSAK
jgi:hypothetical protein